MRPNLTVQFGYGQFNPAGKYHCLYGMNNPGAHLRKPIIQSGPENRG